MIERKGWMGFFGVGYRDGFTRLSSRDQIFFIKRLSFLIRAGVPMLESLNLLKVNTKSRGKTQLLERVIKDVENGQFLHASLSRCGRMFNDFALNLIKVGETGGLLVQNLNHLSGELEKRHRLKNKILGALVYPSFILVGTLAVTALLIVFVFPRVLPIFRSLNVSLPFTTKMLIWVSGFLIDFGVWILVAAALFAIGFWFLIRRHRRVRMALDRALLILPFAGRLTKKYELANFCRTLGLLIKSGIRAVEATDITAGTMSNLVYRDAVYRVASGVNQGQSFAIGLNDYPKLFPELALELITIGETTGNLSNSLLYLSELYEAEVDETTKNLSSSLEPILMVIMGLTVGFLAISIIAPIYEITKNVTPQR